MKSMWFVGGFMLGLITVSLAMGAVPGRVRSGEVTDDTALYQKLSEIRVNRQADLNFDSDLEDLSKREKLYSEQLNARKDAPKSRKTMPGPGEKTQKRARVSAPLSRISKMEYRYGLAR